MQVKENKIIEINNKKFPVRVVGNSNSEYIFVNNHGVLSSKESYIPMEKWGANKYLFLSYDARSSNNNSLLPASRFVNTYIEDLKDLIIWIKEKFPHKKIILIGSSWGASLVISFTRKYGNLIYKCVSWSIPHKIIASTNAKNAIFKDKKSAETKSKNDSILKMTIKFIMMLLFNINTFFKLKIDIDKTSSNEALQRIHKLKKYDMASTKYIWAVYKNIKKAIKDIKYLNEHKISNVLYIQSLLDGYGKKKTFEYLEKNTNNYVSYLLINEFFHAAHWEGKNNLNIRILNLIENWVLTNKVNFQRVEKIARISRKRQKDISFIIPTYNNDQYLKKAILSILNNKKNNFELIIVNDGSTDKTKKILDKYRLYTNVKIVNLDQNHGVSFARNVGIKHAKGEWIVFVDGDDYISKNFIDNITQHIDKTNNFYKYKLEKDLFAAKKDKLVQGNKVDDPVVSRVIHFSLFEKYKFPQKYRNGIEDWDFYVNNWENFSTKDLEKDNSIYYHYTYNPNSLTKAKKVYRSRIEHAISIYSDPSKRKIALKYHIYGHYWIQLLTVSKIWFPDLIHDVKKIKYKQKVPLKIYLQCKIAGLPIIKKWMYRLEQKTDE